MKLKVELHTTKTWHIKIPKKYAADFEEDMNSSGIPDDDYATLKNGITMPAERLLGADQEGWEDSTKSIVELARKCVGDADGFLFY